MFIIETKSRLDVKPFHYLLTVGWSLTFYDCWDKISRPKKDLTWDVATDGIFQQMRIPKQPEG